MGKLDLNHFQEPDKSTPINKLCAEIYDFGEDILHSLIYQKDILLEEISACLFIKMLNTYKGAYLFINTEYLRADAHVLLRHLLETLFILKACLEDDKFLQEYILSDELHRLKITNVIISNPETFKEADISEINQIKAELVSTVESKGIKKIDIQEVAKKARLMDFYNSLYRALSNVVHSGIRTLEEYLDKDASNNIVGFNMTPYEKDVDDLYVALVETQLYGYNCMGKIFNLNIDKKVDDLHTLMKDLIK